MCRSLVCDDDRTERRYRTAVDHLGNSRAVVYLARAHLLYGQWLRRAGRRRRAREELRTAHQMLTTMGAQALAERATAELRATGEHARRRSTGALDRLTEREAHIAQLAATGATSKEVSLQLFLSPRTVEAHLRNIFRMLGITSRGNLRDSTPSDQREVPAA
jgi:DNA-binding CsgD family transcriptional regulator